MKLLPTKENAKMRMRPGTVAAGLATALLLTLVALPTSQAAASPSPWWHIVTGSHPSNLWEPKSQVQEIKTPAAVFGLKVKGEFVAFFGAHPTTAEVQSALEGKYGAGNVEVTGGPPGAAPLIVTWIGADAGSSVPLVEIFDPLGQGSSAKLIQAGGSGRLVLTVINVGDAAVDGSANPVLIKDQLPEGVVASDVAGITAQQGLDCALESGTQVTCTFDGNLPSYQALEIEVFVNLQGSPPVVGAPGEVTISGGKASPVAAAQEIAVSDEPARFGIERFYSATEEEGGGPATQAGGHPFQIVNTVQAKSNSISGAGQDRRIEQPSLVRNLRFPLPAGLVGNVASAPRCSMSAFLERVEAGTEVNKNGCSDASAIGVISVAVIESRAVGFFRKAVPVFNLQPGYGEPARFGFVVAENPVVLDTAVDPDQDYRIVVSGNNVTQAVAFLSSTTVLWGSPGDPSHDLSRGWGCITEGPGHCQRPGDIGEDPFLRQPVACDGPLEFGAEAEPWNVSLGSVLSTATSTAPGLHGCNKIPFDPNIAATATSRLAENPSGLDFRLDMPNSGLLNPDGIAEGQAKKVEVTLPEGMTINPSQAEGLAVCSPADYARESFDSLPGAGCPDASKVGEVQIKTPLLDEEPRGALYVAKPYDNPTGSLIGLYLVARVPERGVVIKQAGKVTPDPKTGQLVTTFDNLPQLPFSSFKLHFREGGRAPLVTPPACGDYDITARFTPWSAKDPDNPAPNEIVTRKSTFTVQRGVDGGACPPGGVPPFHPEFQAGSVNNNAGSYSPFDMRLTRRDGEQGMTRFSSVLPPGVLGKLAGVTQCPEAAIAAAKAKSATEELASPSCPQSSEIGHTLAGAGVGSVLTYVGGKIYLAGPFNGDPLSVVAITPAKAGPFDVGTVVVREALNLNPKTAEVEVDGAASDPIPHILAGIPLRLRDLRVYVDRPDFTLNPTSCEESSAKATLFGSYLDVFSPADDVPVALSDRYQAANCANLGFKPNLALKLKGGTKRGGHPGLTATYRPRKGDANVKGLLVRLPRSAFLDQAHIRTICTRVQFAAKSCPKAAQYGYIKAWTPLLDQPLQGPVYLRSSNHKLPDLVFDLHGLVDVEVATRIDSVKGGIRATVEDSPDAPLSKVLLKMQGAQKGLIVNSRNLCGSTNKANVQFVGQNGKEFDAKPVMAPDCGGKRKGKAKRHSGRS